MDNNDNHHHDNNNGLLDNISTEWLHYTLVHHILVIPPLPPKKIYFGLDNPGTPSVTEDKKDLIQNERF